ncbi:MAG: hypothetical protein U0271_03815 [Polyangiaceae bacterium]
MFEGRRPRILWGLLAFSIGLSPACHRGPAPSEEAPVWERIELSTSKGTAFLSAVAGTKADDVWAVGSSPADPTTHRASACAFHFDGSQWTEATLPDGAQALLAVAVRAHDDIWVGGQAGTMLHFDGNQWTRATLPAEASGATISELSTNGRDVWAAATLTGKVLHLTPSGWQVEPIAQRADSPIEHIYVASDGVVWVPGGKALARQDGGAWRELQVGKSTLIAMTEGGSSELWMFGGEGGNLSAASWKPSVFRRQGDSWSEVPSSGALFLRAACALSSNELVAVGSGGYALRWDGQAWRQSRTGVEDTHGKGQLRGVACFGGEAFAVGSVGVLRLRH